MNFNPRFKKTLNVLIIDFTLIILGIICFVAPSFGQSVFNIVLGCILIAIGVINFMFGLSKRNIEISRTIISAILVALGILICFNNDFINIFILIFIGIVVLFQAFRECLQGFILKSVAAPLKEYVFYFINAFVLLGLSILLFVDASTKLMLRFYVLGLVCLYYGVTDIVDTFISLKNDSIDKSLKTKLKRGKKEKDVKETSIVINPSNVVEVEVKESKED